MTDPDLSHVIGREGHLHQSYAYIWVSCFESSCPDENSFYSDIIITVIILGEHTSLYCLNHGNIW